MPFWPVASGRSVLFPATLSGELVHPSGWKNWVWVGVKERLSFIEGEGQDLHASSLPHVFEHFLMILKDTEEEPAQQLDSTAFASSEAIAEVAGCISL